MTGAVEASSAPARPRRSYFAWLREGQRHRPGGVWALIITVGSVLSALYVLWIGALGTIIGDAALWVVGEAQAAGAPLPWLDAFASWARSFSAKPHLDISVFIGVTFPIAFLTTTARQGRPNLNWIDVLLALASFLVALYYVVDNEHFLNWGRGMAQPTLADAVAGLVLVGLVVELCRRTTGWGLTTLVGVLLLYTFFGHFLPGALSHRNFNWSYFIEMMTITEDGIFGSPLDVASSYALLFVLFGSFYQKAGGGQLFFDLASAITGRMTGGAAKACVTASGLYGSVSGSPVADVATTGPLTIPIMKRVGIPAVRAGAIEATASCGGAMLPPVMGAVAFIMSDITNIPYAEIAWASALPAILYYATIYILIHNSALRGNEGRMPEDQIVSLRVGLARGWRHLLPLGALIGLLIAGYTPVYVAAGSTAAVIVLSWLSRTSAIGPRRFVECCVDTITQIVPLVGAVAGAGIVIGAVEISGLAGKFTLLVTAVSGGFLVTTLILTALFLILLGMGMPTPAVYVTGIALLGPVLRDKFGLPVMQVHLFMLYFACLSAITPPVAVANFAAGAIAGVNPIKLGPDAVRLAVGGFVLPFFFLFNPALNMQGAALDIIIAVFFASALVTFASFALQGWLGQRRIPFLLRLLLLACGVAAIGPQFDFGSAPVMAIGTVAIGAKGIAQIAGTAIGILTLLGVWRLGRRLSASVATA